MPQNIIYHIYRTLFGKYIILLLILILLDSVVDGCEQIGFEERETKFDFCQMPKWSRDVIDPHSGNYSLKSQNTRLGSTSSICLKEINDPESISFFWKLYGELDGDELVFLINGRISAICNSKSWTHAGPFDVNDNDKIEWKFKRGDGNGSGQIDDVCIFKSGENEDCCNHQGSSGTWTSEYAQSLQNTKNTSAANKSPTITNLFSDKPSPQDATVIIYWNTEAIDPEGDKILYRYSVNGVDKTGWTQEKSWLWNTTGYSGTCLIGVRIRDTGGLEDNKSSMYVIEKRDEFYVNNTNYNFSRNIFPEIQQAIDNASVNGIIWVAPGIYNESISIIRPLTLIGDNLSSEIVQNDDEIISIKSDHVTIKGFTICGGDVAISMSNGKDNSIVHNVILNCELMGIESKESERSLIEANIIDNCRKGIYIDRGDSCIIRLNSISNITESGVYMDYSEDVHVVDNIISSANYGIFLHKSRNNMLSYNEINNVNDTIIGMAESVDNQILGNNLTNAKYGFYLGEGSFRNAIYENNTLNSIYLCDLECNLRVSRCGNNTCARNIAPC
ncbi:MAG: NosD domain-containing protein [Methanothrix sp.]